MNRRVEEVKKNGETDNYGSDYLGQLLQTVHHSDKEKRITMEQMVGEIKALYGAGHLTTTNLLAWSIFLLAINTDWQEKARKEVLEFIGHKNPTSDGIARLKNVSK